jgi:hypothetical protein
VNRGVGKIIAGGAVGRGREAELDRIELVAVCISLFTFTMRAPVIGKGGALPGEAPLARGTMATSATGRSSLLSLIEF